MRSGPGRPRRGLLKTWGALVMVGALAGAGVAVSTNTSVAGAGAKGSQKVSSGAPAPTTTTTTSPWVPGVNGTVTVGIDRAPSGCNPNSATGATWADRLVLEPVLPSAFQVNESDQAVYDPALITQAELQGTNPETVVYTINPHAVWSDGVPVSAEDFVYAWHEESGTEGPVGSPAPSATAGTSLPIAKHAGPSAPSTSGPAGSPGTTSALGGATSTGPVLGYRQIESMTPSNGGKTVTVVFRTPYADWQSLFNDLLPAHVLRRTGWNPPCSTVSPEIDLSAGPFVIQSAKPGEVVLVRNPLWWEQMPELARIVIRVATGPGELARWLAKRTVDVIVPYGYDERFVQSIGSTPGLVSQSQVSATLLELEMSATAPLTASVETRDAIAHAIDRQQVVNDVVGWANSLVLPASSTLFAQSQGGYPSHHPPPLQISGLPAAATRSPKQVPTTTPLPWTADITETAKLLTGEGWVRTPSGWRFPTGELLKLTLAYDAADPWARQVAALLPHQLGAAGITLHLLPAPSAQTAGTDLSLGRAELALLPLHSSPFPSQAVAWYTPLLGPPGTDGSQDWTNLDDPTVNHLLLAASEELNPVRATPMYQTVDDLLWQDMVAVPLFAEPVIQAWTGRLAGVSENPFGASLLWAPGGWAQRVPPTSPDTQPQT